MLKYRQLKGAKPPDPITRGFAPGPHWVQSPQTLIWARAPALAMCSAIISLQKVLDRVTRSNVHSTLVPRAWTGDRECAITKLVAHLENTKVALCRRPKIRQSSVIYRLLVCTRDRKFIWRLPLYHMDTCVVHRGLHRVTTPLLCILLLLLLLLSRSPLLLVCFIYYWYVHLLFVKTTWWRSNNNEKKLKRAVH